MKNSRGFLALAIVLGFALLTSSVLTAGSRERRPRLASTVYPAETVVVNGQTRTYRMDVPLANVATVPTAIVFGFHGRGGTGPKFAVQTGFNQMVASENFILVCPNGVNNEWGSELDTGAKDLAMFDAILSAVSARFAIDPDRVFVTGMSSGARFSHLLAAERSDVIAAVAPHSGMLGKWAKDGINASRSYPVFVIHGVNDTLIPVDRAREARELYEFEGHFVKYLEIPNLGHDWATSYGITPQIWNFFTEHPRDGF